MLCFDQEFDIPTIKQLIREIGKEQWNPLAFQWNSGIGRDQIDHTNPQPGQVWAFLDEELSFTKRTWCLLELVAAMEAGIKPTCQLSGGFRPAVEWSLALKPVRTKDAATLNPEDKKKIDDDILDEFGSFAAFDRIVTKAIWETAHNAWSDGEECNCYWMDVPGATEYCNGVCPCNGEILRSCCYCCCYYCVLSCCCGVDVDAHPCPTFERACCIGWKRALLCVPGFEEDQCRKYCVCFRHQFRRRLC